MWTVTPRLGELRGGWGAAREQSGIGMWNTGERYDSGSRWGTRDLETVEIGGAGGV